MNDLQESLSEARRVKGRLFLARHVLLTELMRLCPDYRDPEAREKAQPIAIEVQVVEGAISRIVSVENRLLETQARLEREQYEHDRAQRLIRRQIRRTKQSPRPHLIIPDGASVPFDTEAWYQALRSIDSMPIVECDEVPQTRSCDLSDEVVYRAFLIEAMAPWEQRARQSRRYEGL